MNKNEMNEMNEMNEEEKNQEEMEQVNGGSIQDIVRDYNNREQMKKDFLEGERMRISDMLNRYRN